MAMPRYETTNSAIAPGNGVASAVLLSARYVNQPSNTVASGTGARTGHSPGEPTRFAPNTIDWPEPFEALAGTNNHGGGQAHCMAHPRRGTTRFDTSTCTALPS